MNTTMIRITLLGLILFFHFFTLEIVTAASHIDEVEKYAWSENSGWINFQSSHDGVTVYYDHLEGYAWAENVGWVKLGSHHRGSPHTYQNTSKTNWGVNHDGLGHLSGYAWSETAGWIHFNTSHNQVTLNMETGDFEGYAWSENLGWIHFNQHNPNYKVRAKNLPNDDSEEDESDESNENEIDPNKEISNEDIPNNDSSSGRNSSGESSGLVSNDNPKDSIPSIDLSNPQMLPHLASLFLSVEGGKGHIRFIEAAEKLNHGECYHQCKYQFETSRWVYLIANASEDNYFVGWGGNPDCTDGIIRLVGSKRCTAYFRPFMKPQITIIGTGHGQVTTHFEKSAIILTAIPASGASFKSWGEDCRGNNNPLKIENQIPKNCTAYFVQDPHLTNISTRAPIEGSSSGDIIAEFLISGAGTQTVVIRGIALDEKVDPYIVVKQSLTEKVVAINNNWEDDPRAYEIPEYLKLSQPTDAGLLLDLPAGIYTVTLTSMGSPGIGSISVNTLEE